MSLDALSSNEDVAAGLSGLSHTTLYALILHIALNTFQKPSYRTTNKNRKYLDDERFRKVGDGDTKVRDCDK